METNHRYSGLTDAQVLQSRAKHGVNILTPPAKDPLWKQYLEKFKDPLIVILIIAGMMSIGISCYECFGLHASSTVFFEPVGIFVAILLATGLAFIFEQKADKEFSILNQVNDDEPVEAIRNGNAVKIAKKDVVVGDILIIETGQEIPADAELLDSVALQIDESTLTGEPVCSKSADAKDFDQEATFPTNHVMRGTKVMEGHGVCRVFAVGDNTENGKVFEAAQIDDGVKTPLDEQLEGLGNLITHLSYGFAAAIIVAKLLVFFQWAPAAWLLLIPVSLFFYFVIRKFKNWSPTACITTIVVFFAVFIASVLAIHEALSPGQDVSHLLAYALQTIMIAVTLIVVAVPEGLPMAVTLSLAYSMRRMLKTNNLVRKMHACETMGATTVICTDKTGTLTQNLMQVSETQFYGLENNTLGGDEMSQIITEGIAVNSTAQLANSNSGKTEVLGNPTEGALLIWLKEHGTDYLDVRQRVERLAEIPFSTERKYMATLAKRPTGQTVLYVKGAPEIVFDLCRQTCGQVTKEQVDKQLKDYQDKAMRTLGFAYQIVEQTDDVIQNGVLKANRLTFLGIAAISDPVRSDVPPAVKECVDAGISVKIVTGDTVGTAKEIGRQIGLWNDSTDTEKNIITGSEFAKLADEQLQQRVLDLKIIARARPMDKKRLVEALQARNQVVAVTGDGTNDAPALHAAHVGLSMGDGTSVAKEASDITIIDNSFSSIGRAVMWGRSLYQNIQRFLLFQLTVNVAACFIVLAGAFMGTESPLTVTQMLWVNLIMDTFGAMALSSLPPTAQVMKDKPRDRNAFILNRSMMSNMLGVGGFFFILLLGFLYVFQHADIHSMSDLTNASLGVKDTVTPYEQTLLFSIFVWTHFWYMFNARAYKTGGSGLDLKGCDGFESIVVAIVVGQVLIVEVFYEFFNVVPMKWQDWAIIIVLSSFVMWVRELWHLLRKKRK